MIHFVSNHHEETFTLGDKQWEPIKNFIFFLDDHEDIPILCKDTRIDIDLHDGFCLSSRTTKYISDMIENSIGNGRMEDFRKEFQVSSLTPIFDFSDFLRYSEGLQTRLL